MIKLRDYQVTSYNAVRQAMTQHKRVLMQLPTGGGKTVIAAHMAANASQKGKRLYFICHRQEIIEQTARTFGKFGIQTGMIWADAPKLYHLPIQVCSIDTLKNRLAAVPHPDVCIWDECHHGSAAGWVKVQEFWEAAWHIGLSATPCRLDGKGLDVAYDYMVPGPQTIDLMNIGALSGYEYFAPSNPDTKNLHLIAGEFAKSESELLMDTGKIHGDIVKHYKDIAIGKRAILFAPTINSSKHFAESLRNAGIMSIHLDGDTAKTERKAAAKAYANGDIEVICNVGLFGEGYDLSAQADMDVTVDCLIDAQPTNSLAWALQKWGRVLRPKTDGSKAIILDHAGNWTRHGFPDDIREWSLSGIDKKKQKKEREEIALRTTQCPVCYAVHKPEPHCPQCGYKYEIKSRKVELEDGELKKVDIEAMRAQYRSQQAQARDAQSLIDLGHSPQRADHIMRAREEKDRLRRTLYNLTQGAKAANLGDYVFTQNEIMKMKPKELGKMIDEIGNRLFEVGAA